MNQLPVLFARHDLILGNGFIAGVMISGRALMTQENDTEFWFEGINPCGFSARGESAAEAYRAFETEYQKVLFDIAADSPDYEAFHAEAEAFFSNVSPTLLADWEAAVMAVRRGEHSSPWLRTTRKPDSEPQISIKRIGEFRAADNVIPDPQLALAS